MIIFELLILQADQTWFQVYWQNLDSEIVQDKFEKRHFWVSGDDRRREAAGLIIVKRSRVPNGVRSQSRAAAKHVEPPPFERGVLSRWVPRLYGCAPRLLLHWSNVLLFSQASLFSVFVSLSSVMIYSIQ